MEKALEILNRYHHGIIECNEKELDEAIAELEEAMKPKTCEGDKMKKALEILKTLKEHCEYDHIVSYEASIKQVKQAIAELEKAMKPKTCEGCVYGVFGVDSFGIEVECTLAYRCSRGQDDMFKPKDNA